MTPAIGLGLTPFQRTVKGWRFSSDREATFLISDASFSMRRDIHVAALVLALRSDGRGAMDNPLL